MFNQSNTAISSSSDNYKDLFLNRQTKNAGISSLLFIVFLISLLTGLTGYYLGDRGYFRNTFKFINPTREAQSAEATQYSAEELSQKINRSEYDFELYNQIIANLKDKYVDSTKVQDSQLFEGSLKGMVDSIGDKATNYFSAEDYKTYLNSFSGQFEGIGVRLEYQNNQVVVVEVIKNSPAEKSGVKSNYVFYKVDGKDVSTSSIEDIVTKVRGKAGTSVKVNFIDPEKREEVEKEITRAAIKVDSMRLVERDRDTVIFEVGRFTEDSLEAWKSMWDKNVDEIVRKNYKNVVIDLRGNGGGFLDAAIHASNDFLKKGDLIITEKSKVRGDISTAANGNNVRLKDKKVTILVNGGTASASEIFAGALRHHNGYKVLGSKTFGKGTVQNTYNLPNGGALKITTEYWLLPNGKRLDNENPITPDIDIKVDAEAAKQGKDNILDEAIKELTK